MKRDLLFIGTYRGIPLAVDVKTGEILENALKEGFSGLFDPGGFFSNVGSFFDKASTKIGDSGAFKTVSKAFDPNTTVGKVVTANLQTSLNNLLGGGGTIQAGGFPIIPGDPNFVPSSAPFVFQGNRSDVPTTTKNNNTLLIVGGGVLFLTLITVVIVATRPKAA